MKKLLLCSLALVMIVLAIAGCGKSTSSSSATTKELTFNGETYTVPKDPQTHRRSFKFCIVHAIRSRWKGSFPS